MKRYLKLIAGTAVCILGNAATSNAFVIDYSKGEDVDFRGVVKGKMLVYKAGGQLFSENGQINNVPDKLEIVFVPEQYDQINVGIFS